MNEFPGEITASFIDIRFAYSGLISRVNKRIGDHVHCRECIASLDRKILQIELDKEQAQYEKVHADFEIFVNKNGPGPDTDDVIKYLRQSKQADVNAAQKDIETAKSKMNQADIFSPVNGIVIDLSGLVAGINITPASNPVTILDLDSLVFALEVPQEELFQFATERNMKMTFPGIQNTYIGTQRLPTSGKNGKFILPVTLQDSTGLYPGMKGQATFKLD
jgi:multidrug efflux pump subunit AcrA (membrane-fusion protein)